MNDLTEDLTRCMTDDDLFLHLLHTMPKSKGQSGRNSKVNWHEIRLVCR